mgnify:CR=1 FL=1
MSELEEGPTIVSRLLPSGFVTKGYKREKRVNLLFNYVESDNAKENPVHKSESLDEAESLAGNSIGSGLFKFLDVKALQEVHV